MATDHSTQSLDDQPQQTKILDQYAYLLDAYEALAHYSDPERPSPQQVLLHALNQNFQALLQSPESQLYLS